MARKAETHFLEQECLSLRCAKAGDWTLGKKQQSSWEQITCRHCLTQNTNNPSQWLHSRHNRSDGLNMLGLNALILPGPSLYQTHSKPWLTIKFMLGDIEGILKALVTKNLAVFDQVDLGQAGWVEYGCCVDLIHWILQGYAGLQTARSRKHRRTEGGSATVTWRYL